MNIHDDHNSRYLAQCCIQYTKMKEHINEIKNVTI